VRVEVDILVDVEANVLRIKAVLDAGVDMVAVMEADIAVHRAVRAKPGANTILTILAITLQQIGSNHPSRNAIRSLRTVTKK
jgi:hypothetical protein